MATPEQEQTARDDWGWVPKDEFSGPEENWKDADAFMADGLNVLPIVSANLKKEKDRNKNLQAKADRLESTIKGLETDMKTFGEFQEKLITDTRKQALKDAKEQLKQGVKDDDAQQVAAAEQKIEDLATPEEPKKDTKPNNGEDPAFKPWVEKNPWYNEDRRMRAYANDIGADIAKANAGKTSEEVYGLIRDAVKEAFPEKFSKGNGGDHQTVEDGDPPPKKKKGERKFSDLPKDVQIVVQDQMKRGIIKDEAAYMKLLPADYFDSI